MSVEEKLRTLMIKHSGNLKEFSRNADISYTTLRSILERGVMNANVENVLKITSTLGLRPEFLENSNIDERSLFYIYNQLEPPRQEKVYLYAEHQLEQQELHENNELYVVGQTAAGSPIEGQQAIHVVGADTVNLFVSGDSMEPDFYDGDVIKYRPQPTLENSEIGVFAINGGITMKKFKSNGDIRLQSLNDKYEDIVIKESDDFNILGKVIL